MTDDNFLIGLIALKTLKHYKKSIFTSFNAFQITIEDCYTYKRFKFQFIIDGINFDEMKLIDETCKKFNFKYEVKNDLTYFTYELKNIKGITNPRLAK